MSVSGEVGRRAASATFGKYELFAKLGSGGMAEVFLALSRGMAGFNKLVVLKRLRPNVAEDHAMISMFLDEARLAARLHHPNIVNTYEVGEHDGTYFIAMEYLEGQPLNKILKSPKAQELFTPLMWCHVFAQALAGLHHAHEQKDFDGKPLEVVHRDLSPHNIFVTYSGETKLVDFGIAKASVNTTNTATGILKGKVNYMSPEQVRGDTDRRADLFAVGLSLWEVLAGRGVYRGEAVTVLHRILNDPMPKLSEARPEIDPDLEAIVMKALEKDRDKRYATAEEFREALEAYVLKKGEVVRDITVGKAISTMFQETKDNVAQRIKECVSGLSAPKVPQPADQTQPSFTTGSLPSLTMTPPTGDYPFLANLAEHSDPGLGSGTPSGSQQIKVSTSGPPTGRTPVPQSNSAAPYTTSEMPTSRAAVPWVFVAVAALALVGGVVWFLGSRKGSDSTTATAPKTAKVVLESTPSGAAIEKDGQVVGHTPATLDLPLGRQQLTLIRDGFSSETLTIDVVEGARQAVTLKAVDPTSPTASQSPSSSAVALTTAKSPPGTAYVPVRPHSTTPAPSPSTPPAPSVAPTTGEKGFLSFTTFPWTRVSEGGRVLGTTPLYKVAMTPGTHVLSLDNPDDNIHSTYTVTIKAGEATSRSVELK